ncbi:MAG: efflux RND transporter periplasmic adaptor subunit [Clostridia bacterium]|nr:efflux RND transporter periplasmic adaptor subunit [Clostridia bacterium]
MKKTILAAIVTVSLAVAFTGCSGKKEADVNASAAPTQKVRQAVEAFGVVRSKVIKNINPGFTASIEKVHVREGQKVKRGDVLVTLDMAEYNAQLSAKELELKALNSEISVLVSSKKGSAPETAKLHNDLKTAQELYSNALKELSDKKALLESGSISQYDYDQFKKSVDAKKKAVDDLKFSIASHNNSNQVSLDLKMSRASQLESDIALMKEKLGKSYMKDNSIVADVNNGVVFDLFYNEGDKIGPDRKVLSLMDLDTLIIEADVSEEFIKDVKIGADVTIIPLADKSKSFKGKVARIADKAVQKNGETNVIVEISIDDKNDFLMPNFNVDVKIQMAEKK